MGNFTSEPELTQEQTDLQFLGERLPFTDTEIRYLYKAYQMFGTIEERRSFLHDWSYCVGAFGLFEVLQDNVLPRSKKKGEDGEEDLRFGNALYYATFHVDGDVRPYCHCKEPATDKSANQELVDEYTRRARLEKFFDGLATASRRGSTAVLTALFRTVAHLHESNDERVLALDFVEAGYRISFAAEHLQTGGLKTELKDVQVSRDSLQALAHSVVNKAKSRRQRAGRFDECPYLMNGRVELHDVLEWAESVAPMFGSILPTFFHFCLFPSQPIPQGRSTFDRPVLNDVSCILTESDQFSLACLSPALSGPWYRLYTSSADGLSFNRLLKAVLGYGGPTLFVVRSSTGAVFGAYTSTTWKESKDFYGNTDCFLYQLTPTTSVYLPSGNAKNFMYCNPAARSRGYDQQAHGIGFGGTTDQPRLFFTEHLDDPCSAGNRDLTFENGKLDPADTSFYLDSLEVWGVGGTEAVQNALESRAAKRALKDEAIRRARKVDKAQFLDDFRAGTFDSKAFAHRQQVDGRGRADVDDRAQDKEKVFDYAK